MARQVSFLFMAAWIALSPLQARGLEIVYDTLAQPVTLDGNISDGLWPGLSFETTSNETVLDSVTVAIRNPNVATSGTITFSLFDATGTGGRPGNALGSALGSRPMNGISSATYDQITFSGLNRNLSANTNYWLVVQSSGVGTAYYVAATNSTSGVTTGSTGFTQSLDLGLNWSAPSTANYIVGKVVMVPEVSTVIMSLISGLTVAVKSGFFRRSHPPTRPECDLD